VNSEITTNFSLLYETNMESPYHAGYSNLNNRLWATRRDAYSKITLVLLNTIKLILSWKMLYKPPFVVTTRVSALQPRTTKCSRH